MNPDFEPTSLSRSSALGCVLDAHRKSGKCLNSHYTTIKKMIGTNRLDGPIPSMIMMVYHVYPHYAILKNPIHT